MPLNENLLRRLTQTPGIASREDRVRDVVAAELGPLVDSLTVDTLGNLIGGKQGRGRPRVVVAAHMDEIGFLVRHIDDCGFIRLQKIGGFDPRVLVAQRVAVHARDHGPLPGVLQPGSKPIHLQAPGDSKEIKLEDLFVDLGLSAAAVKERVTIGDMVTLEREQVMIGDTVVSKALDDRLGVYVMIEAMKRVSDQAATVLAIATTQEEVGLRGAITSAYDVEADVAIALDVTIAGDIPGTPGDSVVTRLGGSTSLTWRKRIRSHSSGKSCPLVAPTPVRSRKLAVAYAPQPFRSQHAMSTPSTKWRTKLTFRQAWTCLLPSSTMLDRGTTLRPSPAGNNHDQAEHGRRVMRCNEQTTELRRDGPWSKLTTKADD